MMRPVAVQRLAIPFGIVLFAAIAVSSATPAATPQPPALTLKTAGEMALRNHPAVQAATFTARAAEQVTRELRSSYYPMATADFTAAGGLPNGNSRIDAGAMTASRVLNRYANGVAVDQLITDFGRTSNIVASSRLRAQAATQDTQQTQQDVLLAVNQAYFGVLRAQALLKVAQQTVQARQVLTDQVTALEKNRLRSMVDVAFAQVDLAKAKLLLVQAQNDEKAAYAELANALGLGAPEAYQLVQEPLPGPPAADATVLVAQALQDRPDLASARFTHESALRFARAERDLWMPTISAVGSAGYVPAYQVPLVDHYEAAGINVSVPLFNGFLFSARHQEANLRARAADQNTRDLADRISRDVRVAWSNSVTAYQNLDVTAQLLKQANLALDLAQGRYKLGLSSIVELSQAQLNLTEAEIANTNAQYDYQTQQAVLNFQMGQLH